MESFEILDVTLMEPVSRHQAIFEKFDSLAEEDSFIIHNDYDTNPLYYQLLAERGSVFDWECLQNGPKTWEVLIHKKVGLAPLDTANGGRVNTDFFQNFSKEMICAWD